MPLPETWAYFEELLQQQDQVLGSEADVEALRYGLERFPSLRRITITPATHGFRFTPLYETPMIRSFPIGFNYAIPRGWPTMWEPDPREPPATDWVRSRDSREYIKNQWRGFRVITRVLAQGDPRHRVSELVLDVHLLSTGLNCRIFDQPCEEYSNCVTMIRRPGFRRIDLSLLVGQLEYLGWPTYRNGYLRRELAEATDLEHFSLHTNVESKMRPGETDGHGSMDHFNSLLTIFPVDKWPRLRHFGLSRFLVTQADVMSLLSALPATLRSVELSFFMFLTNGGHYRGLLFDMRDTLGWRDQPVDERPKITLGVDLVTPRPGKAIWVNDEANAFIYGHGPNPFGHDDGQYPHDVRGWRGVGRDEFNPAHERPNVSLDQLMRLGIIKRDAFLMGESDVVAPKSPDAIYGLTDSDEYSDDD